MKYFFFISLILLGLFAQADPLRPITPNDFEGNDVERIQAAIDSANETTHEILIPRRNANGSLRWIIDSAILLPSNMTVILDNCILQLSDSSRDNMFRSDNVHKGVATPVWNHNIQLIGRGDVLLTGADNPRSTGDAHRTLSLTPDQEENWRVSYGSDAGKKGYKQKGDWRNILILMAYVNGFKIKNITIANTHAWAMSFERTLNAEISEITFNLPEEQMVNGKKVQVHNRDGIDLRQGCQHFKISNISGHTEDDFIALSNLGAYNPTHKTADLNSTMITGGGWRGPQDDIAHITITNINCQSNTRAVAIRATDSAGIHNIYINGIIGKTRYNSLLIGGKGYGKPSLQGKISQIYAMNLIGDGKALILIESPIADCVFMNGIYTGAGEKAIRYNIEKAQTKNIKVLNVVKTASEQSSP